MAVDYRHPPPAVFRYLNAGALAPVREDLRPGDVVSAYAARWVVIRRAERPGRWVVQRLGLTTTNVLHERDFYGMIRPTHQEWGWPSPVLHTL